ncbi:hypothetical protein H5410_047179, partial [Solanum commersonii]
MDNSLMKLVIPEGITSWQVGEFFKPLPEEATEEVASHEKKPRLLISLQAVFAKLYWRISFLVKVSKTHLIFFFFFEFIPKLLELKLHSKKLMIHPFINQLFRLIQILQPYFAPNYFTKFLLKKILHNVAVQSIGARDDNGAGWME